MLASDGYTCRNCGVTSTRVDDVYFDVDHAVLKSEGGGLPDLPADRGVTVDARVATLWDASAESIQQVGLLAPADSTREDDVTLVKFVVWAGNDLPVM